MPAEAAQKEHEARVRAELAGLAVRPEDMALVVRGWTLIEPHLARVMAERLPPQAEPAALFQP